MLLFFNDIDSLIKETSYAVPQFEVEGSESEGLVYFDSISQTHRLSAFAEGDAAVSGVYTHGTVKNESDAIGQGDVVLKNGTYFYFWSKIHLQHRLQELRRKVA